MGNKELWFMIFQIIIAEIPWKDIINIFIQMIKGKEKDIDEGLDKDIAAVQNVNEVYTLTQQSPGVPKPILKILHEIAYMIHIDMINKEKFENMMKIADAWFNNENRIKYTNGPDFMAFYLAHPDKLDEK